MSNYDWWRTPWVPVAWFAPENTWHSPAGGRKRLRAELDLLDGYLPTDAGTRSRTTAVDVIRAVEVHNYRWSSSRTSSSSQTGPCSTGGSRG